MNRDGALVHLKSIMDAVMVAAGRDTDDIATGYRPALDSAFRHYLDRYGGTTNLETTVVPVERELCFQALLEALTWDLAMPAIATTQVDFSVDAPLTSVKFSQAYRATKDARNAAWYRASACGWGVEANVDAFRVSLNFNEPSASATEEFG